MGNINFSQAFQQATQDGVLKKSELKRLGQLAERTPETLDNQMVETIQAHAKDGETLNLIQLKLGEHTLEALPLFTYEDDIQHPSIEDVKSGKHVLGADSSLTQTGPAVTTTQQRLKAIGYPVEVTGAFDRQTQRALKQFQQGTGCCGEGKDGLGQVGPVTWKRMNQLMGNRELRQQLVSTAEHNSNIEYNRQTGAYVGPKASGQSLGSCYHYVSRNADTVGRGAHMQGGDAYEAIAGLKNDPNYQEISVREGGLKYLPAGAVVVWEQGSSDSGHISIADGKGNEISDFIQPQWESHYGGGKAHVFLPIR